MQRTPLVKQKLLREKREIEYEINSSTGVSYYSRISKLDVHSDFWPVICVVIVRFT